MATFEDDEIGVLTDAFLKKCILSDYDGPTQAKALIEEEGVEFTEVEELNIGFKNILRISNLWDFKSLKKLQLCNNCIEQICGLEDLKNLEWLDISYNHIEVITGLETLTNLTDLMMSNNKIRKLENLHACEKLELVSCSYNQIEDFSSVLYLRCLKDLRSVTVIGNPMMKKEDSQKVIAYLPKLLYLDFRLLKPEEITEAREKYKNEVKEYEVQEKAQKEEQAVANKENSKTKLYKLALVDDLNDGKFFQKIFSNDKNGQLFLNFPPTEEMVKSFRDEFCSICNDWLLIGVQESECRNFEVHAFLSNTELAVASNQTMGMKEILVFATEKNDILLEIATYLKETGETFKNEKVRQLRSTLSNKITALWKKLMTLETEISIQIQRVYKLFQNALTVMVQSFILQVENCAEKLKDSDERYTTRAVQFYSGWSEKSPEEKLQIMKDEDGEMYDLDPDLIKLLENDEQQFFETILREGHVAHISVIKEKQDNTSSKVQLWLSDILKKVQEDELERNRQKIIEINQYCDDAIKELELIT